MAEHGDKASVPWRASADIIEERPSEKVVLCYTGQGELSGEALGVSVHRFVRDFLRQRRQPAAVSFPGSNTVAKLGRYANPDQAAGEFWPRIAPGGYPIARLKARLKAACEP